MIALYRTDRGRFALDEAGAWQPSTKTTLTIAKQDGLSVAYLCGLLNSELLDVWYAVRGKTPWHVRRNYEPKPMAEIPYRQIELEHPVDTPRLADLDLALARGDAKRAVAITGPVVGGLRDGADPREAAGALERLVRAIAANRRELLPFRDRFDALERIIKDPWSTEPANPDRAAFLAALPASSAVSARVDPTLDLSIETAADGRLGKPKLGADGLEFDYKRLRTAIVAGPQDRLVLLSEAATAADRLRADDLRAVLLPKDIEAFEDQIAADVTRVGDLRAVGLALVEAAERLVCALYRVPADLEEDVVAHAHARGARRAASDAE